MWVNDLVLHHHYIDGFSAFLVLLSKAPYAGNGHSLVKYGNAAEGHEESALRVSVSAFLDYVAPLAKGITIGCETRLARNADTLTEPVNIMLMEY